MLTTTHHSDVVTQPDGPHQKSTVANVCRNALGDVGLGTYSHACMHPSSDRTRCHLHTYTQICLHKSYLHRVYR